MVIVRMNEGSDDPGIDLAVASSVKEVISSSDFSSLSLEQLDASVGKSPSTIAEMCAAFKAIRELPEKSKATIVHDWVGVADWLEERVRRSKDPVISQIVSVALSLTSVRTLGQGCTRRGATENESGRLARTYEVPDVWARRKVRIDTRG